MLYGISAVFDQMPFSNDAVFDALDLALDWGLGPGPWSRPANLRGESGQTVEYALTSRTLLFQTD